MRSVSQLIREQSGACNLDGLAHRYERLVARSRGENGKGGQPVYRSGIVDDNITRRSQIGDLPACLTELREDCFFSRAF
jgi:hypothetical protein